MTSTDIANVGASRPVLISQLLLGLGGCSYGSHHLGVEDGMHTFMFSGGYRNKVTPANTGSLFTQVVKGNSWQERTALLTESTAVSEFHVMSDSSVSVFVKTSIPDPARSLVAAILNGVVGTFANRRISRVVPTQVPQWPSFDLSLLASAVGSQRDGKVASATTSRARISHWVTSLVEVARGGRDYRSRPHLIGRLA